MTEQMYRRRAGEPVKVWRVGDGEPPEWVKPLLWEGQPIPARGDAFIRSAQGEAMFRFGPDFDRYYEPLPAPAPDAREALKRLCEAIRTADAKAVLIEDDAPSYSVPKGLWEVICGAALTQTEGAEG